MPVHIPLSNVGTGASIIALVGSGSYTGNNVSVQTFTYDHTIGIATVVTSSAHGLVAAELPDVIITGVAASIFPEIQLYRSNFMLLILLILLHLRWELELVPLHTLIVVD